MIAALARFWYIFTVFSWLTVFLVHLAVAPRSLYIIVFLVGVIFYVLKLRYVNTVTLQDINYWTIVYYLLLYVSFILVGVLVWAIIYLVFKYLAPEIFRQLFPDNYAFYIPSTRMILTGSSFSVSGLIAGGVHRHHRQLKFTNKVPLFEIVFVFIALSWVLLSWSFMGLFISIIIISTAPEFIKALASRILTFILRRKIDLVNQKVENNADGDWVIESSQDYKLELREALFTICVSGAIIHFKLACLILIMGGPYVLFRIHG